MGQTGKTPLSDRCISTLCLPPAMPCLWWYGTDHSARQTGRVSPRTSSRGGGDGYSKKSNSPNHSSPLHREITNATNLSGGSGGAAESTGDGSKTNRSPSTNSGVNNATGSNTAGSVSSNGNGGATPSKGLMPPPSQPLLEGGSGTDGHSMEMTSIQEEGNEAIT